MIYYMFSMCYILIVLIFKIVYLLLHYYDLSNF